MEIEQRIYQGDRAREVLENEAFQAAFTDIENEVMQQWRNSPARDQEAREKLWLMMSLLGKLKVTLQTTMETGKLAKLDLEHKRSLLARAKDAIS